MCGRGEEEEDDNEPYPSDYNSEDLQLFRKENNREVNDKLDSHPISEAAGPSNSKRKVKDKVAAPSKRSAKNNVVASNSINQPFVPSRALIDEDDDEGELDDEDDQPILRPNVISEAKTRLKLKKLHQQPTGARKDWLQGR
ncbi:hypothetical protein K7X08_023110 [Anisodus acutangulus]|uniref:Uncharacterized protein n=1 Tax=Anisodus acutangulus TaxID=402998 RepID=A0A9Q1MC22_9SOLA|nr:hypothetical protein K7X08_023110 [Anisodus acutangulus]